MVSFETGRKISKAKRGVSWKQRTITALRVMGGYKDCPCQRCSERRGLIKCWKLEEEFGDLNGV